MLDANSLSQLTQLKQSIRDDKNLMAGTVRGSQGRFGFVNLDDGREIFLPPDEMAKVLPGDRVEVSLKEADSEQPEKKLTAELDKLLSSTMKTVVGQYIVRGKGHFVATDMPQMNRWIFLPPKARAKAKDGDFLVCRISRHPFEDGKGQAKVLEVIGKPGDAHIEHKVVCSKHQLKLHWSKDQQQQLQTIQSQALSDLAYYTQRAQKQALPLVTIDSATTLDMDDALCIELKDNGWLLSVAIADPSSTITPNSPLDKAAQQRASTAYLPGKSVSMLPQELSHHTYSLVPDAERPALLCQMHIAEDGRIADTQFEFALVKSHHKLSYAGVAAVLENGDSELQVQVPSECHNMIQQLASCSRVLKQYRQENALLMEEQDDYYLELDSNGHIHNIRQETHNIAHQIVEEAMLATNRSAGALFAQHADSGLFSAHAGFRKERLEGIKALLQEDYAELAELDLESLDGYCQLLRSLQEQASLEESSQQQEPEQERIQAQAQLAALRLMLQAGQLTQQPLPHFGLGMQHYATITSPIRRYQDLHNHRALRRILAGDAQQPLAEEQLSRIQQGVSTARQASRDLENWLQCVFVQKFKKEQKDTSLEATISRVTSQGVSVEIDAWGINGFIKLDPKAFKFHQERMTLTGEELSYCLKQKLKVQVDKVDMDKKRINFRLAEASDDAEKTLADKDSQPTS